MGRLVELCNLQSPDRLMFANLIPISQTGMRERRVLDSGTRRGWSLTSAKLIGPILPKPSLVIDEHETGLSPQASPFSKGIDLQLYVHLNSF
jgi:hypothetical protein